MYGSDAADEKEKFISQKERLTKDVRYQEFNEVTLDCTKMIDHKIMQSRVTSLFVGFYRPVGRIFYCSRKVMTPVPASMDSTMARDSKW